MAVMLGMVQMPAGLITYILLAVDCHNETDCLPLRGSLIPAFTERLLYRLYRFLRAY